MNISAAKLPRDKDNSQGLWPGQEIANNQPIQREVA